MDQMDQNGSNGSKWIKLAQTEPNRNPLDLIGSNSIRLDQIG